MSSLRAPVQDQWSDKGLAQRLTHRMDDEQRPRKGMTNDKLVCQWQLEGFFFFFFTPRQASWVDYTGQVWLLKQNHGSMWLLGHKSRHAPAWFKSEHMRNSWVSPYLSVRGITMITMLGWSIQAAGRPAATVTETKTKTRAHGPVSRHKSSPLNAPSGTITFLRGSPWNALGQAARARQRFEWMELFPQQNKKRAPAELVWKNVEVPAACEVYGCRGDQSERWSPLLTFFSSSEHAGGRAGGLAGRTGAVLSAAVNIRRAAS